MLVYTRRPATPLSAAEMADVDRSLQPPKRALEALDKLAQQQEKAVKVYDAS